MVNKAYKSATQVKFNSTAFAGIIKIMQRFN
jgi:hypothetical protein